MKIGNQLKFGLAILVLLLGVTLSCTRGISVPVSPSFSQTTSTFTSTVTGTPTLTPTATLVNTPTNTPTSTFSGTPTFTASWTPSPTGQATATNTGTSTQTGTFTNTPTLTFTGTPTDSPTDTATATSTSTPTSTPTPTPDYTLLDDFAGTGGFSDDISGIYSIQDENSQWRDGYWYVASDGTTAVSAVTGPGGAGTTAINYQSTFTAYTQLVFTFINSGGPHYSAAVTTYDATVGGKYYGISFQAKANSLPATICTSTMPMWVDFKDNQATSDHFVAVPVIMGWQNYTIYWDQAGFDQNLDNSSVALNPVSIMNIEFQPKNLGTAGFSANFDIANIHLVSSPDPNPPTPVPAALIDDFENGTNQVILSSGGKYYAPTGTGRSGFWFVFADTFGSSECPNGTINGSTVFPDSPGYGSPAGNPQFAAHMTGAIPTGLCTGPSYSNCPFAGLGFDFIGGSTPYDTTQGGIYTGFTFYAKVDTGTATNVRIEFTTPQSTTTGGNDNYQEQITLTNSWAPVSVLMQCTTCAPAGPLKQQGFGTAVPWTPTQVYGAEWEFDNGNAGQNLGLWIDNVSFY